MPKYLYEVAFTSEGEKGVLRAGGTARRKAVDDMVTAAGGKLEAYYFAFGENDVIIIVDLPHQAAASAIALTIGASGGARTKTTVLVSPEEVDAASHLQVPYRPPTTA